MPLILTIKRLPWFSQSKSKERIPEYENWGKVGYKWQFTRDDKCKSMGMNPPPNSRHYQLSSKTVVGLIWHLWTFKYIWRWQSIAYIRTVFYQNNHVFIDYQYTPDNRLSLPTQRLDVYGRQPLPRLHLNGQEPVNRGDMRNTIAS
jgi:hypothetical protein